MAVFHDSTSLPGAQRGGLDNADVDRLRDCVRRYAAAYPGRPEDAGSRVMQHVDGGEFRMPRAFLLLAALREGFDAARDRHEQTTALWAARQLLLDFVQNLDGMINFASVCEWRPSDAFLDWLGGDPSNPAQANALRIAEAIDGWLGAADLAADGSVPAPVTLKADGD